MIKIISYVDIAFFYRKANILRRWSNILRIFNENKGLCHGSRFHRFGWKLALLHAAFEQLQYSNLWCVSQDSRGCSIYEHTAARVFLSCDKLHLLDCSVTWSLLTRTDADWTCWLTADAHVRKHKHKFETDWDSCHTVHRSYTTYKQYTAGCAWCVQRWQNSCILSSRLMTTPCARMLPTRFQETAQSEQHWHSSADIEGFICHQLKIINECTSRSNMP